jgi:taurine dioxygenase
LHVTHYAPSLAPDHPEVTVLNEAAKATVAGWHTDSTYEARPPLGAALRMITMPPVGGDTLWATMYGAYEALSSRMQRLLEGLSAVHDSTKIAEDRRRRGLDVSDFVPLEATHPLTFDDPVTGRRALFANAHYTRRVDGLSARESAKVLELLFDHVKAPELQVRVRWEPGMVVFWNNPVTQHYAVPDYEGPRVVHRITVLDRAAAPA